MLSFAIKKKIKMNIREPRSKHTNYFQNKNCASVQARNFIEINLSALSFIEIDTIEKIVATAGHYAKTM